MSVGYIVFVPSTDTMETSLVPREINRIMQQCTKENENSMHCYAATNTRSCVSHHASFASHNEFEEKILEVAIPSAIILEVALSIVNIIVEHHCVAQALSEQLLVSEASPIWRKRRVLFIMS